MKMTDFEKAVRYTCLFDTDDEEAMIARYKDIIAMIAGDTELIKRKVKKFEIVLDLLSR